MKNLKAKAMMAKTKLETMPTRAKAAIVCTLASISKGILVCPAYCDINGNTAMQKFLKTMFSITVFAGIVLIAAGAASLIRTIVSMASGEQAQPGALGKGIGLIVGGAVLCALKAIVTAIIGSDPTTMTFY